MDTTKPAAFSSSASELATILLSEAAPLIIDVRKNPAFIASDYALPQAIRRDPAEIETWVDELSKVHSVLVYCVHGHEVSQNAMTTLRQHDIKAIYLEGGIENWRSAGFPVLSKESRFTQTSNRKPA
mgnify:CR=1 FL=1